MNWTDDQRRVIEDRGHNVLVSAAAGSGKTAVLVRRIIERILSEENPVDIDQFLIVTFTNAAAGEMKERIQKAISDALVENPENEHLQRQILLVQGAQITTLHSFCKFIIENYFYKIGFDPSSRIAKPAEIEMIKDEILDELVEEKYDSLDSAFLEMMSHKSNKSADESFKACVNSLYEGAQNEPFPEDFYERMYEFCRMETLDEIIGSKIGQWALGQIDKMMKSALEGYQSLRDWVRLNSADLNEKFEKFARKEHERIQSAYDKFVSGDYESFFAEISSRFDTLSLGRKKEEQEYREYFKARREVCKSTVIEANSYDFFTNSYVADYHKEMRKYAEVFLSTAEEFGRRFAEEKANRGIHDFDDLEHFAIRILIERDEEKNETLSDAALQLKDQFVELMVDEYQDSNFVQEKIISAISRDNNRFIVGDVKQSIYRFRNARPDLFIDKMFRYGREEDKNSVVISLNQNFRSRKSVIDGVNDLFLKIMHRDFGDIEYDDVAKLYYGELYEKAQDDPRTTEVEQEDGSGKSTYDTSEVFYIEDGGIEEEGILIADEIEKYVNGENPLYVLDGDSYRKAEYGDCAVLLRSIKSNGKAICDALESRGIPVYMENSNGFFDTREVALIMDVLRIIDNPLQDIPLVAVMRSPIYDFSDEELVFIRERNSSEYFYESVRHYSANESADRVLVNKVADFLGDLEMLREIASTKTVTEVMETVFNISQIDYILMSMPGGEQKKANLELLMELAEEFDESSYKGIHQFVRYVEKVKKQKSDYGEASIAGEGQNSVRVMTIHKSKGLEFPICFVAATGKRLLKNDTEGMMTFSFDYGILTPIYDGERYVSTKSVFSSIFKKNEKYQSLAEELRVLYVALTRARDKLIVVGSGSRVKSISLDFYGRSTAKSYMEWIVSAVSQSDYFRFHNLTSDDIAELEVEKVVENRIDNAIINNFDTSVEYHSEIERIFDFMDHKNREEYLETPIKLTVAEIKRKSLEASEEGAEDVYEIEVDDRRIPQFIAESEEKTQSGTVYGNAWHHFFANVNLDKMPDGDIIKSEIDRLLAEGMITEEEAKFLSVRKILAFFETDVARQIIEANERGQVFREQPFVISVSMNEIEKYGYEADEDGKENVLIQGIIDIYYFDGDKIVLLDYKTDKVEDEEQLIDRYQIQIDLYAKALQNSHGVRKIDKKIYSFSLGKVVDMGGLSDTSE
ncbi:helicase-exonuclease AddAB subunit AddA [Eubacterium xylanophilum]|uniref:helicase-exonuclease AddAB subunit AddA n=1 Tax=Eubacterium xylanophilum TaxID=39497 RepID=UPI00047B35A5|nr:helicase-exonuclease AddAB subunit AddA [Eubacterium xylanophilum]